MDYKPYVYPKKEITNPYLSQGNLTLELSKIGVKLREDSFIAKSGAIYLLDSKGTILQSVVIGANSCPLLPTLLDLKDNEYYKTIQLDDHETWISIFSNSLFSESDRKKFYLVIQADGKLSIDILRGYMLGLLVSFEVENENTRTHEMLFQITKKIYSSMDVDEVLHAIVNHISFLYPMMESQLWLSNDTFSTTLPVKLFNFNSSDANLSLRSFMEGSVIVYKHEREEEQTERRSTLAVPLRGNQGIYGVMELFTKEEVGFNDKDIEYISILGDIAGNAFENAQLYLQSQKLIRELLFINEIVQQLNKSLVLKDILTFVVSKLIETYKAEYCAILRRIPGKECFVVSEASNPEHQGIELDARTGELGRILQRKEAIILSECPSHQEISLSGNCRSFLGVPLLSGNKVEGAILLCDSRSDYFSFDDFKMLEILAQHMNLAIVNASLHNEVERMAITDTLTGLYNRKYINERIKGSFTEDARGSLILIDIDFFKRINDTHGHNIGDQILKQVSEVLRNNIRKHDIAARWGGEELAVYLPNVRIETALEVAERIRGRIMETTNPKVTISSGVAFWSHESPEHETVENLFHLADIALYEAKHEGRNQVRMAK